LTISADPHHLHHRQQQQQPFGQQLPYQCNIVKLLSPLLRTTLLPVWFGVCVCCSAAALDRMPTPSAARWDEQFRRLFLLQAETICGFLCAKAAHLCGKQT
jgi:hypothetical protein